MATGVPDSTEAIARIRQIPIWTGPVTIDPLHGGLSNESWLVADPSGRFVVRMGVDYPFHHVLRSRELMTARAAHLAGFAPEVVWAGPGVMVSRFIEGRTFSASDVRDNLPRIARLLHGFHNTMARHVTGAGFMFWPFHVIRDYGHSLQGSRHAPNLPGFLDLNARLEAAQVPLPIVFAHNDLLPANFIDDGHKLWLIDFEYAGFSTAMFDLAGVSANAQFDAAASDRLLEDYFGRRPDPALRKSLAAMQCAALLREAMWSMVSELHLTTPGVDFAAYAEENLTRLDKALTAYGKIA
jgi:thiamine kinase-like enzyme